MKNYHIISITWGKSCNYLPASVEPIRWDGSASITGGQLRRADLLHYEYKAWCQNKEVSEPLPLSQSDRVAWRSAVSTGGPLTLEGLRLFVSAAEDALITLDFSHALVQFSLAELLEKENLRFHVGSKYGGMPVDIFLGPDARPRLSKAAYQKALAAENRAGCLLTPEDFSGAVQDYYHSLHGVKLLPGESVQTGFPVLNYSAASGLCTVKLQITGMLGYEIERILAEEPTRLEVNVGGTRHTLDYIFSNRSTMPKLEDLYVELPWEALKETENSFTLTYLEGESPLLLHRVAVGAVRPTLKGELPHLPPLPEKRDFHVGTETNLLTPANGDVDLLLEQMHEEQWGDYFCARNRVAEVSEEVLRRWAKRIQELDFLAAASGAPDSSVAVLESILGDRFHGNQAHEISNLAYGWGDADPIEERLTRTLKDCKDSFLKRMGPHKIVGQALPLQHLDYEAGVEYVMTEVPASNASLVLHGARGAAAAYDRSVWGVHVANHVTRAPLDQDHVRRLFILLQQCWLHGASIVQDEEVALRYNHDTVYAYSDPIPTAYRKFYQSLYHYGNQIKLETPVVRTGFLQGNYDLLIGGLQAAPWVERTKFWGAFGPETESWEFNTPEAGWKLIDSYMPGVWLYPVLQDRKKIRLFFTGSPYGQVDLVPITAAVDKLCAYPVLVLPGWNTMTGQLYENLREYVRRGGHLVLCAAQCTEHVTREFLLQKQDFAFFRDGDLSQLAGVRVSMGRNVIRSIRFGEDTVPVVPGIPGLDTRLCGAVPLATDDQGNPVLVEHRIGSGRVWMLCAGEYWGADGLKQFRNVLCQRLAEETEQTLRLYGDTAEVDYYEFAGNGYTRLVLLNTDWTTPGNSKQVTVSAGTLSFPVRVTEGVSKHILIGNHAAVAFEVPSCIVDNLTVSPESLSFTLHGAGEVALEVFTESQRIPLTFSMGSHWNSRTLQIPLI